jgi:DNA-directed RNA polymerase specialized sigma24 family protein
VIPTSAAAQQGDALALDRLLDELAPYVRRLCARIARPRPGDATQEALLAVFRGLPPKPPTPGSDRSADCVTLYAS